jgi:hypothetical protein
MVSWPLPLVCIFLGNAQCRAVFVVAKKNREIGVGACSIYILGAVRAPQDTYWYLAVVLRAAAFMACSSGGADDAVTN